MPHDGRVLIAGGFVCCVVDGQTVSETSSASAELYDFATGSFTPTGSMAVARGLHQATLLPDGRVLVVGGVAQLGDRAAVALNPGPTLQAAWPGATATLLGNGKVLVFGGESSSGFPEASTLLFE